MAELIDLLRSALSDRYSIERELGSGGMATVYLAQDLKHDRQVAIKVMRPELSAILGGERFLREIRIAAKLNHPHILALHDSGEADGFLYYVMPYVEGESLRAKIGREKQLSIDEAVSLTRQVASALDYAHEQGVVHRDVKPENILLHRAEAVVADFGIALAVTAAGGERLTETGLSLGTPEYMSPEQATGGRDVVVPKRTCPETRQRMATSFWPLGGWRGGDIDSQFGQSAAFEALVGAPRQPTVRNSARQGIWGWF